MSTRRTGGASTAAMMLLSAAIFAFFGFFYVNWSTPGVDGQVVLFRMLLGWTLKITAIMFAISAVLTFISSFIGNVLYGVIGVLSAVLFLVVAGMDVLDKQHTTMAYGPIILVLFALWNGFGAVTGLKEIMASQAAEGRTDE